MSEQTEKIDNEDLKNLIVSLSDSIEKERRQSEPYKYLFNKSNDCAGLLRAVDDKMVGYALDASAALKDKFSISINDQQWYFLLALPLLVKTTGDKIEKEEGSTCYVDKTYYILSKEFIALGEDLKKGELNNEKENNTKSI